MQRVWVTSPSYEAAINHLIEIRKSAGLSQRDLAERLGKPRSFVSKLESRERRLDVVEFLAYSKALGVDPSELVVSLRHAVGEDLVF
jgi:transcriptional regulator with XRE-family HTH domain